MKIYFDKDKNAIAEDRFMKERAVCIIDESVWKIYSEGELGKDWDIVNKQFVKLVSEEDMRKRKSMTGRISELKRLLDGTDYVMSQITEAKEFHPEDVESLKGKYAQVIEDRIAWRDEIESLIDQMKPRGKK